MIEKVIVVAVLVLAIALLVLFYWKGSRGERW